MWLVGSRHGDTGWFRLVTELTGVNRFLSGPASTGKGHKKADKKPQCPWNWKICEAICAVGASLAASEDFGEQEGQDLWRRAGVEYRARANAASAAGKWPAGGTAEHPPLAESIRWRAETPPEGKPVWDRWIELRKEVVNVILPIFKTLLPKAQGAVL